MNLKSYPKKAESWVFLFDLDSLRDRKSQIEKVMEEADFWENGSDVESVLQENKRISETLDKYQNLVDIISDIEESIDLSEIIDDPDEESELENIIKSRIHESFEILDNMTLELLLSEEYDQNNAILSINSGTGGLDAQDWSQMLLRMYIRWSEGNGYKVKLLDMIQDPEAGIKTATIMVMGINAYGYLKSEKGVHRLVRISPFDSSGKRHTSFASVDVMPELDEDVDVVINQSDLKVDTYRASGAGGQHVNTTDSAVRITHIPTGVVVQCQNERSQKLNREVALKMLYSKLTQIKIEENKEKIDDLKGSYSQITWGSQIRSYVFQPYKLVKDHRTNFENPNVDSVMDGNIDGFIMGYLKKQSREK